MLYNNEVFIQQFSISNVFTSHNIKFCFAFVIVWCKFIMFLLLIFVIITIVKNVIFKKE